MDRPVSTMSSTNSTRPPGKIGRDVAEKMDLAAAHFGKTVTAQPHELDLGAGSDPVECADEVGDKHRCTLEQRDDDEVVRGLLRDLGGERLDPRGDLRLADKSAYTLHLQTPKRPGRIAKLCP